MRFATADAAFWRWLELDASLSAPKSVGLALGERERLAERCECKSDRAEWSDAPVSPFTGRPVTELRKLRCARCMSPWPRATVELTRVQSSIRPGVGVVYDLAELATLEAVLLPPRNRPPRLTRWHRRVYYGLYLVKGQEHNAAGQPWSYDEAAQEGARLWPRAGHPWTEWTVRRLVRESRQRIEHELDRRGLLA